MAESDKKEVERVPIPENLFPNFILSARIDRTKLVVKGSPCFGLEWDVRHRKCGVCAMNELCSLKYQDELSRKEDGLRKKAGIPFLDETDFGNVSEEKLTKLLIKNSSHYNIMDVVDGVMELAKTADEVAAKEWVKRFIKKSPFIVRDGIVYHKPDKEILNG